MSGFSVVIPTLGRSSLQRCLDALAAAEGPLPDRVIVVDDRLGDPGDLPLRVPERFAGLLVVLRSGGRGPAAARNLGWRAAPSEWVAFLDDDVIPFRTWRADLVRDLDAAGQDDRVAGVQGRIRVPLPPGRRPTDWERATAGLATARWITADMAYRCLALRSVDGFDERFRRAFREDSDLALRLMDAGWQLRMGKRESIHPVRPASRWVSLAAQAGNADDMLMLRLHGPGWRARIETAPGRRRRHFAITAAGLLAVIAAARGRRRLATLAGLAWLLGAAEFAAARIRPGPRTPEETATMLVTSVAIPPLAAFHTLRGLWAHRHARPWSGPAGGALGRRQPAAGSRAWERA